MDWEGLRGEGVGLGGTEKVAQLDTTEGLGVIVLGCVAVGEEEKESGGGCVGATEVEISGVNEREMEEVMQGVAEREVRGEEEGEMDEREDGDTVIPPISLGVGVEEGVAPRGKVKVGKEEGVKGGVGVGEGVAPPPPKEALPFAVRVGAREKVVKGVGVAPVFIEEEGERVLSDVKVGASDGEAVGREEREGLRVEVGRGVCKEESEGVGLSELL